MHEFNAVRFPVFDDPMHVLIRLYLMFRSIQRGTIKMRVFVMCRSDRIQLDVGEGELVSEVKEKVRTAFRLDPDQGPTGVDAKDKQILCLTYAGAILEDYWFITDLGIPSGSTLKVKLKEETNPSFFLHCSYNDRIHPVYHQINFHVADGNTLRGIASRSTGLPVGVFRLFNKENVEIFDCHVLDNYSLDIGDTIRLQTWEGWDGLLNTAFTGSSTDVADKLSKNELLANFQMKVVLYIAAHFGYVDLASYLLKKGARADEAVGDHPTRLWCSKTARHVDSLKAPVHEASEFGQLAVLRLFIISDVCSVYARDGNNLTPLTISLRKKQRDCAAFLLTKQWNKVHYVKKNYIPLAVVVKMKNWADRARNKVFKVHGLWKSSTKSVCRRLQSGALCGQGVMVNGYPPVRMSGNQPSESRERIKLNKRAATTSLELDETPEADPETYFKALKLNESCRLQRDEKLERTRKITEYARKNEQRQSRIADADGNKVPNDRTNNPNGLKLPKILRNASLTNSMNGNETGRRSKHEACNSSEKDVNGSRSSQTSNNMKHRRVEQAVDESDVDSKIGLLQRHARTRRSKSHESGIRQDQKSTPGELDGRSRGQSYLDRLPEQTLEVYERQRGLKSRDYAVRCLSLAESFTRKTWLRQVEQAVNIAAKGVRNVFDQKPHLFRENNRPTEATSLRQTVV